MIRTIKFFVYSHTTKLQVDVREDMVDCIKESATKNLNPGFRIEVTNGALYLSQVSLMNSDSGVCGAHWFEDEGSWASDICEYAEQKCLDKPEDYVLELKADVRP